MHANDNMATVATSIVDVHAWFKYGNAAKIGNSSFDVPQQFIEKEIDGSDVHP